MVAQTSLPALCPLRALAIKKTNIFSKYNSETHFTANIILITIYGMLYYYEYKDERSVQIV